MKKLMLAVCLMFGGATLVSAQQDQSAQSQTQSTDQDQDRQEISPSELPDEVSAQLESQDFSGWTVEKCYKKTDENKNDMYIIELKQGEETKKVKFDQDGNKLEHDKTKEKSYDKADQQDEQEQQ